MEFIPVLCAFLLFLYLLFRVSERHSAKHSTLKLPPGPRQLPILGNMLQLLDGQPHHKLRDLAKKHGPLMHLQLGAVSTIVVTSPEVAREVYKTHDVIFAQRPVLVGIRYLSYNFCGIAFSPYGDYWRKIRKICMSELLSTKRVQTFRAIREEETRNLIESIRLHNGSTVNLSSTLFSLTYAITARAAFGKRSKHEQEFMLLVKEIATVLSGFSIADMYPSVKLFEMASGMKSKLEKLHRELDVILEDILNEHKAESRKTSLAQGEIKEDLVDVLLKFQKPGELQDPLTDDNIKAVILDIFSGGSETSSTILEWAISELLKHPEVIEKAQAEVRSVFNKRRDVYESGLHELHYLQSVIKETLRLHPAAPLSAPRESSEKCEINGFDIPAKTRLIVNLWAIGRDPSYWTDEPEKFIPERFSNSAVGTFKGEDFSYIPFGAGRRICPGISFGLANIDLPLAKLLFHFNWKLQGNLKPEQLDMTEKFGLSVRRKHDLHLIPVPYYPPPSE